MSDLHMSDTNIRSQSSLGTDFERLHKKGSNIDRISLARVVKVNYRYNTVDVTSNSIGGSFSSESTGGGRYSAKLPVQFGGTTNQGKPFGQVNPVEVGTLVLIGFLEGNKVNPIVLSIYGNEEENVKLSRAPFEGADPEDEDLKGLTQQKFTVYPSLTYENVDGTGNRTVSFTGKSFVVMEADASPEMGGVTDDVDGTQYEDLDSSYYYTGELIEPKETRSPVILFKHQGDKFARNEEGKEEDNHNFMWFLDQDGTYRQSMMQEDEDWRAFFEMTPNGTIQMVRNNDTKNLQGTSDRHSIGVEEDGVRIHVGDRYSLITPEGTFGNLGLGLGSGGVPSDILDEINETIDEANRNILDMGMYMEQTEEFITMGGNLLEEIEGNMVEFETNFTILADEIRASVSETRLRGLVNQEIDSFMGNLDEINREAEEHLDILDSIIEDSLISPSEKETLAPTYQGIKVEYPSYLHQAEENDRPTENYTRAYDDLVNLMDPILNTPSETSSVTPLEVREAYTNYFNARQSILSSILTEIQGELSETVEKVSEASLDAQQALADAGTAMRDAGNALSNLEDIAVTNTVTPQEKPTLKRDYDDIVNEYNSLIEQALDFEVSYLAYEEAYDSLESFINSTGVFDTMSETTELNGEMYFQLVEDYYRERIALTTAIAKETKTQLTQITEDFEYYNTQIVETSKQINLIAESVVAIEDSVQINKARLTVANDRISARVTKSGLKREIDENRNTLNATGKNLYVQSTQIEDSIIEQGSGDTTASEGGAVSTFIEINSGVMYNVAMFDNETQNTLTYAFYNTNGEYIKGDSTSVSAGETHIDMFAPAPPNARFIRASLTNIEPAKIQVERGNGSGFFMYSNQDLLDNLEYATTEKENREIAWQDRATQEGKSLEEGTFLREDVESFLEDNLLTVDEAQTLIDEISDLEDEYENILSDAEDLEVQTVNLELGMNQLRSTRDQYIAPIIKDDTGSELTDTDIDIIYQGFDRYLTRRQNYYSLVEDMFRASYESSVEVLDDVMAGSLEAERIAREAAIAAERAAQSVSSIEYEISMGNTMESNHIDTANSISEDGILDPVEKEKGQTLINEIVDEIDWLIAQGNSVGLGTSDLQNAYNQLTSYYAAFVTPENLGKDSAVNQQTFVGHFQTYHVSKLTFLENLLKEAERRLIETEEDAKLARDETHRRDEEIQQMQNILDDSEVAIDRIEKQIEELEAGYYVIEVISTNGFTFKDRVINTSLETIVYWGTDDVTEEIPNENFEWIKKDINGDVDTLWTEKHKGVGPIIDLTHEDVQGKGTFTVEVYIDEEEEESTNG